MAFLETFIKIEHLVNGGLAAALRQSDRQPFRPHNYQP